MGRPINPLWREKVLEACSRKNMTLLEPVGTPAMFSKLLVSCEHHPEGRNVLVKSIITSKNCCHKGNALSESGRQQRSHTMSGLWDNPETKVPLLRSTSGHYGSDKTKLYICKILTSDNKEVLKFGRSERGTKRFGSYLVETIYEQECSTEYAKKIETLAHLRFSEYSADVELNTSGYTECYNSNLPIFEVMNFFEEKE